MPALNRFFVIALSTLVLQGGLHAAESTLSATIPWQGEGQVYKIAPGTMLFLGAFEGVMYVETSEGVLDEGFVRCPLTQKIDVASQQTSATGHCMITVSGGETVYADWSCKGEVGICRGRFDLKSGTGRFEGVSGDSELVIRSPMGALVGDMANGSVLSVAAGIAMLPKLRYRLATD